MERLVGRGSGDSTISIKWGLRFRFSSLNWIQTWTLLWATVFYSFFLSFFSFWVCRIVEVKGYT
jgi:hypothetical protein